MALFLALQTFLGVSLAAAQATVQTDKPDYYPGDTVIVTGSGWMPGETVSLTFDEFPVQHEPHMLYAHADSLGDIRNEEYLIEDENLGSTYVLFASGATSGLAASTTFTDSPKVGSVVLEPQDGSLCSGTPGFVTYLVTVNRGTGMGSSGNFLATLTAMSLPTGAGASFVPNPVQLTPTEDSDTALLTVTTNALTPPGTFTFRVKASTSASDTAATTATLQVNQEPTITCPANLLLDNTPGLCARNNVTFAATATGTPAPTITYSPASGSSFPVGTTTVTATATNSCGSTSCTFTVTILDAEKPSITAPAAVNRGTGPGATTCAAFISDGDLGTASATDNCSGVVVTRSGVPAGNVFPAGSTTITYTATDASGNSKTATQVVTVVDNTPPALTGPPAVTRGTGPGATTCAVFISDADLGLASATDNCSATTVSRSGVPSGNLFPAGTTTITYTATDAIGNSSTATQVVTVTDTTPPVLTTPGAVARGTGPGATICGVLISDADLGLATATDNCSGVTISRSGVPSGNFFPAGSTTITYTATDDAGNSSTGTQVVTVTDNTPPDLTAPAAVTRGTGPGATSCGVFISDADLGLASATDNCSGVTIERSGVPSGNIFPAGSTTITYTATDDAGNSNTGTQVVTVTDNTPPVLTAPAAVARGTGPGATICGVFISDADLGLASATDNCSGVTIERSGVPSGNIFPAGSTTITYTARDDAGNTSTATQVVTVTDNTPPAITTSNLSVSTDHGLCTAVVAHGTTATDNCGTPTLTGTRSDGLLLTDTYPKGVTTISWLATDGSGNTATATQTITVSDTEDPTIATTNLSVFTDPTLCSAVVAHGTTADDNCSGVVLTGTRSDGLLLTAPYPDGITTISWLATDTSGNTATATQTIEVKDNENPTLTPPPAVNTSTSPLATICGKFIDDTTLGAPTAHDNCSVNVTRTGVPAGNIFPVGSTTITYTATDPTGNSVSATQTVTVVDDTNPVITTANINANTDGGLCTATVAHGTTATDNCGTPTLTGTRSDGLLLTDAYPKGVTTITWLATDLHSNTATATQTITVIDNEAPALTPPAAISVNTGPGAAICGLLIPDAALGTALATDNCSVSVTRTGVPAGNIFPVGSTTLTYTAMDPSGNTTTGTQVVTVVDNTPPVLAAPAAINAVTGPSATICGKMISDAALGAPVASDNCSVTVTRTGVPTGNIFPVGTTTITYTAKDPSGNTTVQTQIVAVVDNTPPAITTANISVPTGTGVCTATIASLGTTATDNCGTATLVGTRGDGLPLANPYPKGTTTITWVATDGNGNTSNATQTVEVTNPPPVATITAPASGFIIGVGQTVAFAGSFTDNTGDVHTVQWTLDAITFAGTVNEAARTTAGSFTFSAAGVYSIKMTVTDQCNQASTATQVAGVDAMVVVYDPSAGFVTGGGWINSPPGAYPADPSLVGKANFGFVSKYKKGQSTPSAPEGETEFQFKAGSLNFHSTSYEWLVISGAKAQFKGWGTINDTGSYGFMLTSTDGQVSGGGGQDKFRMKITNKITGVVVYDSQLGASDTDPASTPIAGGSIVIHTSSGFLTAEAPGSGTAAMTTTIHQNTPNPFNPSTTLRFSVADPGRVSIRVFNVRGELVTTLRDEWVTPGAYEVHWDGKDRMGRPVSSGAYFAVMSNDRGYRDRIRMVLLK